LQARSIDERIRESLYLLLLHSSAQDKREKAVASKREDEQGNQGEKGGGGVRASKAMAQRMGPNFIRDGMVTVSLASCSR
jgi:hypothetical protein